MYQREVYTSLETQFDLLEGGGGGGRSVPAFLRKPLAICDFPRGKGLWTRCPSPTGSAQYNNT